MMYRATEQSTTVWESGSLCVHAACLQEHLSPLYDLRGVQTWKEREKRNDDWKRRKRQQQQQQQKKKLKFGKMMACLVDYSIKSADWLTMGTLLSPPPAGGI